MENNMSMPTTKPIVLNLGVFLPDRDDLSRMPLVLEFNLDTGKVIDLKYQIAKVLQLTQEELILTYAGTHLNDADQLTQIGIRNGALIQVIKTNKPPPDNNDVTIDDIKKAVECYNRVNIYISGGIYSKLLRGEFINLVLIKHPELIRDIGAFAILLDTLLLDEMKNFEVAKRVAKKHPLLITCAEDIKKAMKDVIHAHRHTPIIIAHHMSPSLSEDSLSDSSLNSEIEEYAMTNHSAFYEDRRHISREQLTTALSFASTISFNSLPNVQSRISAPTTADVVAASSSSSSAASSSSSSSSSSLTTNSITNTELSTALSQTLIANSTNATGPTNNMAFINPSAAIDGGDGFGDYYDNDADDDDGGVVNDNDATASSIIEDAEIANISSARDTAIITNTQSLRERFTNQLNAMHEMGLYDDVINIQSLIGCNGDVAAAVNLVITNLNNLS